MTDDLKAPPLAPKGAVFTAPNIGVPTTPPIELEDQVRQGTGKPLLQQQS